MALSGVPAGESRHDGGADELRESEQRYKELFENTSDCIFLLDITPDGRFRLAGFNPAEERAVGLTSSAVTGKLVEEVLPEAIAREVTANYRRCVAAGRTIDYQEDLDLPSGRRAFHTALIPVRDAAGRIHRIVGVGRDVTERKRAEAALRESEELFRLLTENSNDLISLLDVEGRHVYMSPSFNRLLGGAPELGSPAKYERVHPEDLGALRRAWEEVLATGRTALTFRVRAADGSWRWLDMWGRLVEYRGRPHVMGVNRDVTERKQAEEQVRASLREKEVLLKEVHHRVKNNLQLISSLLSLQAARVEDPAARDLLADSRNRVRSMALVHENLYRAGSFARVPLGAHVRGLCDHLLRSYGGAAARVRLDTRLDDVSLDLNRAVPCVLLVNELVSNALKHAFPGGRAGRVSVELRSPAGGRCALTVADDGIGLPAGLDPGRATSLGLQLVGDLAEQLRASVAVRCDGGTSFTITFDAGGDEGQHP